MKVNNWAKMVSNITIMISLCLVAMMSINIFAASTPVNFLQQFGSASTREDTYEISFKEIVVNYDISDPNIYQIAPVNAIVGELVPSSQFQRSGSIKVGGKFGGFFSKPNGDGKLYYGGVGTTNENSLNDPNYDKDENVSLAIWDRQEDTLLYPALVKRDIVGDESTGQQEVILNPNGGNLRDETRASNIIRVTNGGQMPSNIPAPTRDGYTFLGYWSVKNNVRKITDNLAEEDWQDQYYDSDMQSTRAVDWDNFPRFLSARWQSNTYHITFQPIAFPTGEEGTIDAVDARFGEMMPHTKKPFDNSMLENGRFGGVFSQPDGNGKLYYGGRGIDDEPTDDQGLDLNVSLATWDKREDAELYPLLIKRQDNKQEVILNPNGGNLRDETRASNIIGVTNGEPMPSDIPAPTRYGYTFLGYWEIDNDVYDIVDMQQDGWKNQYYDGNMQSTKNVQLDNFPRFLSARWERSSYQVSFDNNGGDGDTTPITQEFGVALPTRQAPTREGYKFLGYFDFDGKQYYSENGIGAIWDKEEDSTLYAKWQKDIVEYQVKLDRNDGSGEIDTIVAKLGANLPTMQVPTRQGYEFLGYFDLAQGGEKQYYNQQMIGNIWDKEEDSTLYAKWQASGGVGGPQKPPIDPSEPSNPPSTPQDGGGRWIIIVGIVLGAVGIGVASVMLIKKKRGRDFFKVRYRKTRKR